MRADLFWLLSFCGFAALSLLCGILVWPQLVAVWPSIEEKFDRFRRLPPFAKLVLLLFVGAFVVYGSTKTNQVGGVGLGLRSRSTMEENILCTTTTSDYDYPPPTVTPEDIARGWQLLEVRTNFNISYTMPEDATLATNWWLRGAYEDVKSFDFGDWRFPFGTNEYSSLWAFSWGKVRFSLGDTNTEIVAVGVPMSAVPYHSRLWSAETTNSTLITWEDFTLGRHQLTTNNQQLTTLSAQIELRTTGDFVTRSNEVETVYRRVDPDDYDGDGWRNDDDPDPYVWEEYWDSFWQELPDGANESAYCWIEIRPRWHSYIEFFGDGPSDLDDPYLWAKAGETYRVQLLIGKSYTIVSSQPVDVVGQSNPSIEIDGGGTSEIGVVWPVTFSALEGNGTSFMMRVVPSGLGGTFTWAQHCCTITGYGNQFWWAHERYCYCGGCYAYGVYSYEGYEKECTGGHCGCPYYDDDDPYESEEDDGPYAAGASVEFSESVVIFEDVYTNMPGEVVARQSTQTTLTCVAHGGDTGGTATFTIEGDAKLVSCAGGSLPVTRFVPPLQKIEFEIVYEGKLPSSSEDDIIAKADFTERGTGTRHSTVEDELTSVKVELEAVYIAPTNHNQSRHVYGVGEKVRFKVTPVVSGGTLRVIKTDVTDNVTDYDTFEGNLEIALAAENLYRCPAIGTCPDVTLRYMGVEYRPLMTVVEPQSVEALSVTSEGAFWPGDVCMGVMVSRVYVKPFTVSFSGVQIYEVPCTNAIPPTGYFDSEYYKGPRTHVYPNAGYLHIPDEENYVMTDRAGRTEAYTNWSAGTLTWKVPIGWRRIRRGYENQLATDEIDYARLRDEYSRPLLIGGREDAYTQTFKIESDGTSSIRKFGYKLERNRWLPFGFVSQTGEDE